MTKDKLWLDGLTKMDSTIIIAVLTSCLYFFGYGLLISYYGNLSISINFLTIPLLDYLTAGLSPLLVVFSIVVLSIWFWSQNPENYENSRSYKKIVIFGNIFFAFKVCIIYYVVVFDFISNVIIKILIVILLLISFIYPTFKNKSVLSFYGSNLIYKLILVSILIIFVYSSGCILGNLAAEKTIHGTSSHSNEVQQLILKDKTITEIENINLILVLINENKYYFIEKNVTITRYPKLYIIPNDQIEIVILKSTT